MPHALLLSPDDQAVSAITGVLEEMSVTCERPLDGVSAAQKLNSQSFDLVLVDCENLPAAKLIFDVCRRGKNGNNPVPIAIVDGRAGLPTAFRLGAELILTKPVSKDQARSTIRSAVGRVRKDVPANESVPAQPVDAVLPRTVGTPLMAMTEERAQAAAATASSQLTSFADSASSVVPTSLPTATISTLSAPALTPKMRSAVDEIDATVTGPNPKLKPSPASFSDSHLSEASLAPAGSVNSKPKFPLSDDPVLAELERTEIEESQAAESQQAESQNTGSAPPKTALDRPAAKSDAPVFSSYQQGRQKPRGALVASLVLSLAAAGFYAAWTYQPGFRQIAQPQIDRVLELTGIAHPSTPAPNPVKLAVQPAPAPNASSASPPETPTDPNKTLSTTPDSATNLTTSSATASPTTSAALTSAGQPTPGAAVTPSASGTTTAAAPVVIKPETSKLIVGKLSDSKPSQSKKDTAPTTSPDAPLPGESSAIILSSKGAEKRLAHSVPPKYPAEARSGDAQGTVVLKEVVDVNGKVEGVRLVEGDPALAAAAINAVKQWRYRPYERDGRAQPFQTVVIIDFQRP